MCSVKLVLIPDCGDWVRFQDDDEEIRIIVNSCLPVSTGHTHTHTPSNDTTVLYKPSDFSVQFISSIFLYQVSYLLSGARPSLLVWYLTRPGWLVHMPLTSPVHLCPLHSHGRFFMPFVLAPPLVEASSSIPAPCICPLHTLCCFCDPSKQSYHFRGPLHVHPRLPNVRPSLLFPTCSPSPINVFNTCTLAY